MTAQAFEGWSNYPTWVVSLWIDNDEGFYKESRRRANVIRKRAHACDGTAHAPYAPTGLCENCSALVSAGGEPRQTPTENATYALAQGLKALLDDHAPDLGATVWSDLLTFAIGEVLWAEIAEHILSELE